MQETVLADAPMSEETAKSTMERAHHFQATCFTRPPGSAASSPSPRRRSSLPPA
jgi:hypothetical protein